MNSVISNSTYQFYAAASLSHLLIFSYSSYFFRFRKLSKLQVLALGTGLFYSFGIVNNTLYKLIVDRRVVAETKKLGYSQHV